MAYPTLKDLEIRTGEFYTVENQLPSDANPVLLGQLGALNWNDAYAPRRFFRVGGGYVTIPGTQNVRFTLQVYVDSDSEEVGRILGQPKPDTGWTTSDEIQLDPDKTMDIILTGYNGTGSDATAEHKITLVDASPRMAQIRMAPDQGVMLVVSGICDHIQYTSLIA